jgi:hypothetical protein
MITKLAFVWKQRDDRMYKIATFFKKAQIPGVMAPVLIDLYKQELEYQSVSKIEINNNTIDFSDKLFKLVYKGQPNKFGSFSSGQITIEETEQEYIVNLSASMGHLVNKAGIVTGLYVLFLIICGIFNTGVIFFGLFVFLVLTGIPYLWTVSFFPVYFTGLRDRIERTLQNELRQP